MPIVTLKLLPALPLTHHQALGVIDTTAATPEATAVMPETNAPSVSNAAPVSSLLLSISYCSCH
jgi:hypothetical protein